MTLDIWRITFVRMVKLTDFVTGAFVTPSMGVVLTSLTDICSVVLNFFGLLVFSIIGSLVTAIVLDFYRRWINRKKSG